MLPDQIPNQKQNTYAMAPTNHASSDTNENPHEACPSTHSEQVPMAATNPKPEVSADVQLEKRFLPASDNLAPTGRVSLKVEITYTSKGISEIDINVKAVPGKRLSSASLNSAAEASVLEIKTSVYPNSESNMLRIELPVLPTSVVSDHCQMKPSASPQPKTSIQPTVPTPEASGHSQLNPSALPTPGALNQFQPDPSTQPQPEAPDEFDLVSQLDLCGFPMFFVLKGTLGYKREKIRAKLRDHHARLATDVKQAQIALLGYNFSKEQRTLAELRWASGSWWEAVNGEILSGTSVSSSVSDDASNFSNPSLFGKIKVLQMEWFRDSLKAGEPRPLKDYTILKARLQQSHPKPVPSQSDPPADQPTPQTLAETASETRADLKNSVHSAQ